MNSRCDKRNAFTLVEIMIVVAIIGLLAALAMPSMLKARQTSRINMAKNQLRIISDAMDFLAFDSKCWPGGLVANVAASPETWDLATGAAGLLSNDGTFADWSGPYLEKLPVDPWGQSYFFDPDYEINGVVYAVVGSLGPNKIGANDYTDADNIVLRVE